MSEEPKGNEPPAGEKTFSQKEFDDHMAGLRRTMEREISQKFGDYEDLKAKAQDFEKHKTELETKDLENKKEYDKLKEGWTAKENEYKNMLTQEKESTKRLRVNYELNQEIMKQNAHADAAQLLQSLAQVDDNGNITIKGKDANGMDTNLSVTEGVKSFLKERPYLVKATGQGGAGTSPGSNGGTGSGENQLGLGDQLMEARKSGDMEKYRKIKQELNLKYQHMR
jgi:hypothetical protein